MALRHGDTTAGRRKRVLSDPPDVLLATPESLKAILASTLTTPRELFADLHTVVVNEVHAFAGDDRGWHLLAVLERLSHLAGRPLQRIGLSATVGNPEGLLLWLQGVEGGIDRPLSSHRMPPPPHRSSNWTTSAPSPLRRPSSPRCTGVRRGWCSTHHGVPRPCPAQPRYRDVCVALLAVR